MTKANLMDNSVVQLLDGIPTMWPFNQPKEAYSISFTLKPIGTKKLKSLRCNGWEVTKTKRMTVVKAYLKPESIKSAKAWLSHYNILGHNLNILLKKRGFKLCMNNPICSKVGGDYICFNFLNRTPAVFSAGVN